MGFAIAHGKPIESPCLTTRPGRTIRISLSGGPRCDLTGRGIIINHMKGTVIRTIMILKGSVRMTNGNLIKGGITSEPGCSEKQLEVHHVVNNHGITPLLLMMIPTPDNACFR